MPIRNPFARRPDIHVPAEENTPPNSQSGTKPPPTFERVDTVGSRTSAVSIRSGQSEPAEYKLSVVNDSGVYLPPSPPEKKGLWPRRSNVSNTTRTSEDIEHFSISRESFDSYRRSFDISARSPIIPSSSDPSNPSNTYTRQSLDSSSARRLPRSGHHHHHHSFARQPATAESEAEAEEAGFEDVGLDDKKDQQGVKKRGFFSKFAESDGGDAGGNGGGGGLTGRFHIGGRKRGMSGGGEELGSLKRPGTAEGKGVVGGVKE